MRASRGSFLVWLAIMLVVPCVSAAPPTNSKPAQKSAPATAPAKLALTSISAGTLVVEAQALGADARIEKALDEATEIEFIGAPLTDVIEFLKRRHKIEIQLDNKALEEAGVALDTQITRHLKGITLRSALRLMLRDLELTYVIRDEVLLITTVSNAESIVTIRVYAVGDLLGTPDDEILDLDPAKDLIALITKTVGFTTWNEVGGIGAISYLPAVHSLVISQTLDVHEEICSLLCALRKVRAATAPSTDAKAAGDHPDKMFVVTYLLKPSTTAARAARQPGKDENATPQAPAEAAARRSLADDLARAVPLMIDPASWKDDGQGTIESIGVGVVVRQTQRVQLQVARFLRTVGLSIAPADGAHNVPDLSGGGGDSMF